MKLLSPKPYSVLFFGTDFFSLAVFKPFYQAIKTLPTLYNRSPDDKQNIITHRLAAVCLPPLKPDRPTSQSKEPLRYYCRGHNITVHDYNDDSSGAVLSPKIDGNEFDIGVVASFGQLIPKSIIEKFRYGIVNIHPSLLPKYRGSTPLQRTILNGDRNVGVTLSIIEPDRFDVGRIIEQREYDVDCDAEKLTSHQLGMRLARVGSDMLLSLLTSTNLSDVIAAARPQPPIPSELRAAYSARKLYDFTPEAFINWDSSSAIDVERQYRALHESFELKTWWNDSIIKLGKICVTDFEVVLPDECLSVSRAGSLYFHIRRKLLCILCGDGRWVTADRVVLPQKQPMTATDFYNGYLSKNGKYDGIFQSQQQPSGLKEPSSDVTFSRKSLLTYDRSAELAVASSKGWL